MINLLPDFQKEVVRVEYKHRMLIVGVLFVLLTIVIATVSLFPSYLISKTKYVTLKERADVLKEEEKKANTAGVSLIVKDVSEKLSLLNIGKKDTDVGMLISKLVDNADSSVKIMSITYEKRGATAKVDIAGVAEKRESMIAFIEKLKKDEYFSEVYSPVSNLVKESNISFNIQIGITP